MIASFNDRQTDRLFSDNFVKKFSSIETSARRKLEMLHAATSLEDLRMPPSNRLEKLSGNRLGQYSIRINDQYRICFEWTNGNAHKVEIVDYH